MVGPVVSVVLPVYNGARCVEVAARSILTQTFRNLELVAVNDGSTDGTAEILERLAREDRRVRIIHQENQGIAGALNRGLAAARGSLVARMDADDASLPQRIFRQVQYLEANPWVGVLASYCEVRDVAWSGVRRAGESSHHIRWQLLLGNPITHPTVMMRRDLVQKVGGYRDLHPHNEDYDLWTRLIDHCSIETLPEVLLRFNSTAGDNISTVYRREQHQAAIAVQHGFVSRYVSVPRWRVQDLFDLLHGLPLARISARETTSRIHGAARLLLELRDAFAQHHPDSRSVAESEAGRHLVSLETALRRLAGTGRVVAALHHLRWDPLSFSRTLPPRLTGAGFS
jgi:glycosyltransferase involved in cell wall biosynthesis